MSWMNILTFLSADDFPNENMTLLPADDPLDENRDGDREDGEADGQLVKEGMILLPADTAR